MVDPPDAEASLPRDRADEERERAQANREAVEYYRQRSRAPGVAEGGGPRNHYCFECDGVIELEYDRRKPPPEVPEFCPHCGAKLEGGARRMFNWVEIDQTPASDARALLPLAGAALLLLALVVLGVLGALSWFA